MDTDQDFNGWVAVKAIIVKDGKVLVVRDHHDSNIWEFPGGHLSVDENVADGLVREVKEEIGADIRIGNLIYSEQRIFKGRGTPHLFLMFAATLIYPSQPFMVPSQEIAEARWIDKTSFTDFKFYEECKNALEVFWKI
jgi:ADP-ribose pyrophosphatase YjhB (NUDIX family)